MIAGGNAKYKGVGTINGAGDYGFMLTAIDAELTPSADVDLFCIKIWDRATDEVVYDNKMGESDDSYGGTTIRLEARAGSVGPALSVEASPVRSSVSFSNGSPSRVYPRHVYVGVG